MNGNKIVDSYKIIVFGDTNGDSWYDGTDAMIVNCIVNGMLTREQVGESVWTAADCNHDCVIDENDVALLNEAGLLLSKVDQTKTVEELAVDSAYQEYLSLIDQNPTVEETKEETVKPGALFTESSILFDYILKFFIQLFELIKSYLTI